MTKTRTIEVHFRIHENELEMINYLLVKNPHLANVSELMRELIVERASAERTVERIQNE